MIKVDHKAKKLFKIDLKANNIIKNNLDVSSFNSNLQQQLIEKNNDLKNLINTNGDLNKIKELRNEIQLLNKQLKNSSLATSIKTKNVKFSARTIRLGLFYKINNLWLKIFLVGLLGIISSIIIWLFVQYTGLYSAGVSGIIQGIAKIVKISMENSNSETIVNLTYNIIFWCLYFLINIPLLIFAYFKIGKEFSILTVVYITFSQLIGFGLGFINNGQGIFIFTNMSDISESSILIKGVQLLPWNSSNGLVIGLFIYGLIYAIISGTSYSIIYILGACTGGTDIFGFYYSKIKNKSIGTLLTYFNAGSLFIGVLLGSFVCWIMKADTEQKNVNNILEAIFSPNLIASLLATTLSGLIYNYFFPKNKIIKVQLYSKKSEEVALLLIEKQWTYKVVISDTNSDSLSGSTTSKTLETVCSYVDLPILMSNIREIDTSGLITIYSIFGVDGELPTTIYERQGK